MPSTTNSVDDGLLIDVNVTPRFWSSSLQPLHLRLRLQPQRVVGLDAKHEVDAALEVEAQLELLVHEPARPLNPESRRQSG